MRLNLKYILRIVILAKVLNGCQNEPRDKTPCVSLFDGETLNGWIQLGGNAMYAVKEHTIVGTTVHNTP